MIPNPVLEEILNSTSPRFKTVAMMTYEHTFDKYVARFQQSRIYKNTAIEEAHEIALSFMRDYLYGFEDSMFHEGKYGNKMEWDKE